MDTVSDGQEVNPAYDEACTHFESVMESIIVAKKLILLLRRMKHKFNS